MIVKKDWIEIDWDWDDGWMLMLYVFLLGILALLLTILFSEKRVTNYYLNPAIQGVNICVKADIEWDEDKVVYCSNDKDQVLDFLNKANESLKGRK